jgi:uncharacterized coiled-coil DUF342 family protein
MGDVGTLVTGIGYKVRKLITRNQELRHETERYRTEIVELKRVIEEQKTVISRSEEKVNTLKLAKTLENKEGIVEAKGKINELVREIDKCIGLLNT